MAQYSIQLANEIQDGSAFKVKAAHLLTNFTAIISDLTDRVSKVTSTAQTIASALTVSGAVNFGSTVALAGDPTTALQAATKQYADATTAGLRMCAPPVYASSTTFTVARFRVRNTTNTWTMTKATSTTVNIAQNVTSGQSGIAKNITVPLSGGDLNVWYHLYVIDNSSASAPQLMLAKKNLAAGDTFTAGTDTPTGYNVWAQLPFSTRINTGPTMPIFRVGQGWPYNPEIIYQLSTSNSAGAGNANILAAGTAGVFTDVDLSPLVPPTSQMAILRLAISGAGTTTELQVRTKGDSAEGFSFQADPGPSAVYQVPTDTAQDVQYRIKSGSSSGYIDVLGFVVDQVPTY